MMRRLIVNREQVTLVANPDVQARQLFAIDWSRMKKKKKKVRVFLTVEVVLENDARG